MKKLIPILICIFLLSITIVACILLFNRPDPDPKPQATYEEQKKLYDGVISIYTELLTSKRNGEELTAPDPDKAPKITNVLYGIVNLCRDASDAENLGYGFKDVDGNGTPELFLLTKTNAIRAILTLSNGVPTLLEAKTDEKTTFMFADKNRFFLVRDTLNGNIQEVTVRICRVDGSKMSYDSVYGRAFDTEKKEITEIFMIENGSRTPIDNETFNTMNYEYSAVTNSPNFFPTAKLYAPKIHFPLSESVSDKDLPVADFSSYADIRKTCVSLSVYADTLDPYKWYAGEYDNLFSFPNDRSYEYYNTLLYCSTSDIGYDETDINGDGTDELLLLDETYRIIAIFTKKNGTPVLLDAFEPFTDSWLDGRGFIHAEKTFNEPKFSLYEFSKDGKYERIYSILPAKDGNTYLVENGKTEKLTSEKYREKLTEYRCYSEPFVYNEHTRNVFDLTYTPLIGVSDDLIGAALGKTWHKNIHHEATDENIFGANSNVYLTFERVTDTQITVHFNHRYTTYYPDPNRENFLLSETSESYLTVTGRVENGVLCFDESGIKGRIEFGSRVIWLVVEESTDGRFMAGNHCYSDNDDTVIG